MTQKQRKVLLICIGVVVASYIVRNIVIGAMQIAYQQQAMRQQRAKPKPKPAPPAEKKAPAPPSIATRGKKPAAPKPIKAPPSPFARVSGVWRGRVALDGRGNCDLKFELKENEPGHFAGYSTMTCTANGPLVAKKVNRRALALNRMDPEAAILSGVIEKGSIEFHADKVVGTDSNGCAPTSFILTPFGANQLAAEWRENTCEGGHLVLRRARQ